MMTIKVTQQDIKDGKRLICEKCPVALAIKRALARSKVYFEFVYVHRTRVMINNTSKIVYLDRKVHNFIHNFDDKLKVSPFDFELNI